MYHFNDTIRQHVLLDCELCCRVRFLLCFFNTAYKQLEAKNTHLRRMTTAMDTKQTTVSVTMVIGSCRINPVVSVQNIQVKTRVHALAWSTGGK